MATSTTSQLSDHTETTTSEFSGISPSLKFVLANLKNFVQSPMFTKNYSVWHSQIIKICRANGFDFFLDPNSYIPENIISNPDSTSSPNPTYAKWILTDQNLAVAIFSTISAPILPYVLHLESTSSIWTTLETHFQSTNRYRVIQ
ncbi:hypothetical protein KFK09_001412 [Dendrobium nobile]|uniref:Retrotransposon Copia-like N-terminal domain-containing protein n=1 Tax=Dendrobium nobile TaxID=94219 RepID=A0A8T3C9I2_DENNO|nr:hypothetical protein KFK09_001412 [Dendrobium nobile]